MITQDTLLQDLQKVKNILNKIPSSNDYDKLGHYHSDTFRRRFKSWNNALKKCFGQVVREKGPLIKKHPCKTCGKITKNPKYCSKSCAGKINNKNFPKRKPECFCRVCKKRTRRRDAICKKCSMKKKMLAFGEKRILEFKSKYARHKYQNIRSHAHRVARFYNLNKPCKKCGYSTHTELCHIKAISDFDKNTKIKIVNNINNLVYLCRTHHWELEHGFLKL